MWVEYCSSFTAYSHILAKNIKIEALKPFLDIMALISVLSPVICGSKCIPAS